MKKLSEMYIAKRRKLCAAFMDVGLECIVVVIRIYGVGGKLLNTTKSFYKNSKVCVRVDSRLSGSLEIGCDVPLVL